LKDEAMRTLRITLGTLLAGHGAQKLFGWFDGHGMQETTQIMQSLNLHPGRPWALRAGVSEFGGGVLTMLGLLHPLGPLSIIGSMSMATAKVHWGKPIWSVQGGAELPLSNSMIATALLIAGPDKYTLDRRFGTRAPRWLTLAALAGVVAGLAAGNARGPSGLQEEANEPAEPRDTIADQAQEDPL
jgi:putative oxidoreductase